MAKYAGSKEAFALALLELADENEKVCGVFPDSIKAMRAVAAGEKYPERMIECGIAEQCAIDVAAGLAASGMSPVVGTYCGFMSMRGCEMMRTFVGYPNLNVKFVGGNAGCLGGEREGVTHQFYEDLGIISSFPNYTILTPGDPHQAYKACKYMMGIDGPVYVRLGSGKEPFVFDENAPFNPDGITIMKEYGYDAVLMSNGYVLDRVLTAAEILKEQGINVVVADINILYGKNPEKILEVMAKTKQVVTIEDHNINGGLGSYISRLATENTPVKVKRIALTTYAESGPAKELGDAYGFSPEGIANTVKSTIQ